ncbi:MAG: N-6 DNA methylase, partial [Bacteroidetes bacterium]|nr:N-6 DNA methylase [Bacteroidota bacterium]
NDICNKNTDYDRLFLFKKTQKLLDRFLFLFFAEDRGLVSPNWTRKILQDWTDLKDKYDNYIPLYTRFRKNFDYLNTGYHGKDGEIFAYNGGLFAPDDILDSLTIDDDLLFKGSLKLSNYDFESEVDVNILGHIFEHSLNEIDEIQASLTGEKTEKVSKRKKDGVFYTPKYITKYIVENTIGALCIAQKEKLEIKEEDFEFIDAKAKGKDKTKRETLNQKITEYRNWLLALKIVDPACGSGAFLNQALEFLIAEHTKLDEIKATLLGGSLVLSDVENSILENNLYGVDINEEAVEIAKLSLWLRTARKGRKLNSLNQNLKCGNSLIDDVEVAGDKAFNWNNEFKEVFDKGGFDVVIGNPPYVNSKEEMFTKEMKNFFTQNYKTSAYQIDLYILFLEKSLELISKTGMSSLIVPNSWLNNLFLENVRKFFLNNSHIVEIVSMPSNTFLDANVDTIIVTFENSKDDLTKLFKCTNEQFKVIGEINQKDWLKEKGTLINIHITKNIYDIFKKLNHNAIALETLADIGRGVGVYHKRIGHTKEFIEKDPYQSDKKEDETFLLYLRGRNVQSGYLNWNNDSYISYGKWLAEPREPKFFNGKRIVLRQIPSIRLIVAYLEQAFVIDQSVFIARFYDNSKFNPKSIMSILGSKLMAFYFKFKYSEFDDLFPKVKLQHFKSFPISKKLVEVDLKLGGLSDEILELKNQQQENSLKFQRTIQRKFEVEDLPRKLQDWHLLTYDDFIKELAKKKAKLKLSEEAEWEDYFKAEKNKLSSIKNQIDIDDKQIDKMVYELYELTEEEIKIVEGI